MQASLIWTAIRQFVTVKFGIVARMNAWMPMKAEAHMQLPVRLTKPTNSLRKTGERQSPSASAAAFSTFMDARAARYSSSGGTAM